jgi:predicted esterase
MDTPALTFPQLRGEVFRLHGLQDWQGALELLDMQSSSFDVPAEVARILYWRACFLALMGRGGEAIATLEGGLQQGYWWSVPALRSDPDLQLLREQPDFVAIMDECQRRHTVAELESQRQPLRLVAEPRAADRPCPLLLALHGYGENAAVTLPRWDSMTQHGWLVAALQSSQLADMDGYHWVDEARAAQEVREHVQALAQAYPLDMERVAIGGFSNGGRIALLLALTGVLQAQAVISVGAGLRDETLETLDWEALRQRSPRLVLIVGALDTRFLEPCVQQVDVFRANGLTVDLQIVPDTGHVYPADFAARLAAALA